jgi:lysozyme family protein
MFFEEAYQHLGPIEGGWSDHPDDRGGPTNYGITMKAMREYFKYKGWGEPTLDDLKKITPQDRQELYKTLYWDFINLDLCQNRKTAIVIFDQSVNRGAQHSAFMVQSVLVVQFRAKIKVDGQMGPLTYQALSAIKEEKFLLKFFELAQQEYVQIVKHDPSQIINLSGWLNRTYSFLDLLVS